MAQRSNKTEQRPEPRLYLITPPVADTAAFAASLAEALAAGDVAAVLLRLAVGDERSLIDSAKALGSVAQDAGAALLLDGHVELVARAGADGAHLTGLDAFSEAIAQLKPERIAGAGGLASRHDAMTAAETGADYVMFGEPDAAIARPSFAAVEDRIVWWAQLFEIPCVGYAAAPEEVAPLAKAGADFVALGDWLWRAPHATVVEADRHLRVTETTA
jgi:thiamine-phosphate pyrophosphorylase